MDDSAIDGKALEQVAVEIDDIVLEFQVVFAIGRAIVAAARNQSLVIPAGLTPFGFVVGLFLKAAVHDAGIGRIGLLFAGGFGLAGHGNEQRGKEGLFFELAVLLGE